MNTKQRWLAIAGFGLMVLLLAKFAPEQDEKTLPAKHQYGVSKVSLNEKVISAAETELKTLHPRHLVNVKEVNMFQSQSWYVAPPPPPKVKPEPPPPPPPPAPPQAPPLPYSFTGSFQEPGGKLIVYLSKGNSLFMVSQGDMLESSYKIESVNKSQMVLVYLPLNIRQNLRIGDH